jgi:integrase
VFARADGTPPDPDHLRRSVLYPILKKPGIAPKARQHGFHIFRHSAGSIVAMASSLKVAQEYLRHADFSTTASIYVYLDDSALRQATELLAEQYGSVIESDRIQ